MTRTPTQTVVDVLGAACRVVWAVAWTLVTHAAPHVWRACEFAIERCATRLGAAATFSDDVPLGVIYDEKDAARAGGARWNASTKQWYAPAALRDDLRDVLIARWGLSADARAAAEARLRESAHASAPAREEMRHDADAAPPWHATPRPSEPARSSSSVAIPVYEKHRVVFCPAVFERGDVAAATATAAGAQWASDGWIAHTPATYHALTALGLRPRITHAPARPGAAKSRAERPPDAARRL